MTTKTENSEIAVLQTQVTQIIEKQVTMEKKQDDHFATLSAKIDNLATVPLVVTSLEKRIASLEKARSRNWLFNTASAGVGALLFFLVQYAITHQ